MAKITVAGNAVVITSTVKAEELKKISKYRPDALTLYGGEDGKEPLFAVGIGSVSSVNKYGITFNSNTADGNACATMVEEFGDTDAKEFVAEKYGNALTMIEKIEAKLPAIVAAIDAEKNAVLEKINIA